jgi:hypothetical protein
MILLTLAFAACLWAALDLAYDYGEEAGRAGR